MLSVSVKQMLIAFDSIDPQVRFKEVYLGCLPPMDVDYTSVCLPGEYRPMDMDGVIASNWRKLLPEQRSTVHRQFSNWDGQPSLEAQNRLMALIVPFVSPVVVEPVEESRDILADSSASSDSEESSSEEVLGGGVNRVIQEVCNIRYMKAKGEVMIQVRYLSDGRSSFEWIKASDALQPHVVDVLKRTMIKLK